MRFVIDEKTRLIPLSAVAANGRALCDPLEAGETVLLIDCYYRAFAVVTPFGEEPEPEPEPGPTNGNVVFGTAAGITFTCSPTPEAEPSIKAEPPPSVLWIDPAKVAPATPPRVLGHPFTEDDLARVPTRKSTLLEKLARERAPAPPKPAAKLSRPAKLRMPEAGKPDPPPWQPLSDGQKEQLTRLWLENPGGSARLIVEKFQKATGREVTTQTAYNYRQNKPDTKPALDGVD